jgi:hypothetical protein
MRILATALWLVLLSGFCLPQLCRAGEIVQAPDLESGLHIERRAGAWQLIRGDREALALPLPLNFRAYRVEALEEGWIITGSIQGPEGMDLLLIRGDDRRIEVLPQPDGRFGVGRANPVPLVEEGSLRGLAWIEGRRQEELIVRAARWDGDTWGNIEQVSPRGPGAQMALTGTVLANSDWLLLWAGFDGEDDEILWSRRSRGSWGEPQRVHSDNNSPDITPTVVATDGGALAAWSELHDGHYRLRLARWDHGTWEISPPSGGQGALYPRAFHSSVGLQILHLSVNPEGWSLIELDRSGAERSRRHEQRATRERPLLVGSHPDDPDLRWVDPQ